MFYEVVWTRALSLVLGNSTQASSLMLTSFLLGLALGAAVSGWMVRRGWSSTAHLALVRIIGLSVFAASWVIQQLPSWFMLFYKSYHAQPLLFLAGRTFLSASVLLIPALIMGIVFPLCIECKRNESGLESDLVGQLYAINIIGAIAGSLLAGLILIESLGMYRCMLLGMWLNLGFSAWHALQIKKRLFHLQFGWVLLPIAMGAFLSYPMPTWDPIAMTRGVYFYAQRMLDVGIESYLTQGRSTRLLFYQEGTAGTVTVRELGNRRVLYFDGRAEGSYMAIARIPGPSAFCFWTLFPGRRRNWPWHRKYGGKRNALPGSAYDVFELEPAVIKASTYFDTINHQPLKNTRVRVLASDARNALALKPEASYDLIISQPSNPWVSGSSKLFTDEFYRLSKSRLRSKGIFAQWVQLFGMEFTSVASLLSTFKSNFPYTYVFEVWGRSGEIILIGSKEELVIPWTALKKMYDDPVRTAELSRIGAPNPGALLARLILGPTELAGLPAPIR